METILRLIRTPRAPFIVALFVGFCLFVGGVLLGNLLRLAACPLCILQRMLYLTLGLSALIGLLAWPHRAGRFVGSLLMLACTACGVFIAGYQTYIQRFAQDVQCSGEAAWWELLVDWAGERAPLLFQASGLCSDPAWKFLGLSIAEYSLLGFSMLMLLSLFALFQNMRHSH